MISTKKHPFWVRGSQVMPQNTQILLVWGKDGISPYFHKKRHFELCEYFLWINNIKTMWFAPSDILFGCMVQVLLGNLGMDPDRVQPTQMCVSQLWLEIFHVLEFSQRNCIYRLTEKCIENLGKLSFEFHIAFGYLAGFHQTFFSLFPTWKFLVIFKKDLPAH